MTLETPAHGFVFMQAWQGFEKSQSNASEHGARRVTTVLKIVPYRSLPKDTAWLAKAEGPAP